MYLPNRAWLGTQGKASVRYLSWCSGHSCTHGISANTKCIPQLRQLSHTLIWDRGRVCWGRFGNNLSSSLFSGRIFKVRTTLDGSSSTPAKHSTSTASLGMSGAKGRPIRLAKKFLNVDRDALLRTQNFAAKLASDSYECKRPRPQLMPASMSGLRSSEDDLHMSCQRRFLKRFFPPGLRCKTAPITLHCKFI